MMKNYSMNFATNTLTITKDFEARLMDPESPESAIFLRLQSLCPSLKVIYKTHRVTAKSPRKGMTFEKMERYIRLFENSDELLLEFCRIKAYADTQKNKYECVYRWFTEKFPFYDELPTFSNGKLILNTNSMPLSNLSSNSNRSKLTITENAA